MKPSTLTLSALIFLFTLATAKAQSIKLDSGLVAYYTFDNHTYDVTKNGHDGIGYNVSSASGHCGQPSTALYFNGTSSYIEIPDDADLRPKQVTFAYWVNLYSDKDAVIFGKSDYQTATNEQFSMAYNYYKISNIDYQKGFHFGIKQKDYCSYPGQGWDATFSNKEQLLNTWHFVVASFDGSLLKIYMDGILLSEGTANYSEIAECVGGTFRIGQWWSRYPSYFNGLLDEFRFYNRAITFAEIQALYKECQIVTDVEAQETNRPSASLVLRSNPSQSGIFEIENASAALPSQVFDPMGNLIEQKTLTSGVTTLDLSVYPSGIYVLKTEKGLLKLIKQ